MRQLFQDLIRPQRRVCSGKAFLLPRGWPDAACLLYSGHRGPSVLLPINRITTITSARTRWALWNCLGEGGRSSHHAVLLIGKRKGKEQNKTLGRFLGRRAWAPEERGRGAGPALLPAHVPRWEVPDPSRRRADRPEDGAWGWQSGILPVDPCVREQRSWGCRLERLFLPWLDLRQDVGVIS